MVSRTSVVLLILIVPLSALMVAALFMEEGLFSSPEEVDEEIAHGEEIGRLNATIFKLGDVTDSSLTNVNLAIFDYFMAEKKPLTVGVIVEDFGNAAPHGIIYKKVKRGHDSGLFEMAIHGFSGGGTTYDQLDYETQLKHFKFANTKLTKLLGSPSEIFAPPRNKFSADTIRAMANSDPPISIISVGNQSDNITLNPYKLNSTYDTGKGIVGGISDVNGTKIYHVVHDISYLKFRTQNYTGDSLQDVVVQRAQANIEKYGFAVVILHPTDFCVIDEATGMCTNQVDPERFKILTDTVDELESLGYGFAKMGDVVVQQ